LVSFEILELETIKKQIETLPEKLPDVEPSLEVETDNEAFIEGEDIITFSDQEETRIITTLSMPSKNLKVKISKELLSELERLQVDFKLN